jgi:hypothetical protein
MRTSWLLILVLTLAACRDTLVVPTRRGVTTLPKRGPLPGLATRPLASPPSYLGTRQNGPACDTTYPTVGYEPADGASARRPLFLYFVGTAFRRDDVSAEFDTLAARVVTEAMARRGFVALSVAYDNGVAALVSDHHHQTRCLFDAPTGVIARACALPQVDCDQGIALWGHSQGAAVAVAAANHDARVRAVWATGYGGDMKTVLSPHRLRVVNGENDQAAKLDTTTGLSASACTGTDQCLREDGSGWIIVRRSQLADPERARADHCWFDRPSCQSKTRVLEPTWIDPASTRPYALERNADWVAETTRRADLPWK